MAGLVRLWRPRTTLQPGTPPWAVFRRLAAAVGLLLLLGQALLLQPSVLTGWLSDLALMMLAVAVFAGIIEALTSGLTSAVRLTAVRTRRARRARPRAAALTAAISVAFVQMWFRPWGALAWGDVSPPVGVAWIGHLFAPWWGTGSSLGGPNGAETELPWAWLLAATHAVGISGVVAEDAWLSALVAAAALAALALQQQLGVEPIPAGFGALLYVLSPLVVAQGWSPLYFACMVLLAAGPALVIAVARGRLTILHGVIALAATAPLVGYVYISPPLCGLVLAVLPAAGVLVLVVEGRRAGRRAGLLLAIGLPALLVTSLYWVVPSALQLSTVASHQLAALTSWTWTESRATVRNAFWLNTTWTWGYSLYNPSAPYYRQFPLAVLRFAPATLAFGALVLPAGSATRTKRALRTTLAFAGASLFVIFLSTGTLPPGSTLFDFMYSLPFGWLLQDPGRFLLIADLGYAVLCGLSLQALLRSPRLRRWLLATNHPSLVRATGTACLTILLLVPAYPLLTGAVVAGRQQGFASAHVNIPSYWPAMARFVNTQATPGNLLVLPVDDFYEMPYRWYYGNDGFIMNQISRPVLDPVSEGYAPADPQLLAAVTLAQQALIAGNWTLSRDILGALSVRFLLVRGDLIFPFPGRSFANPAAVAGALHRDPFAQLVRRSGPLLLYEVSAFAPQVSRRYATTNVLAPDLRALAVLPSGYRLVSSHPIPGVPAVTEFPLATWSQGARSLTTSGLLPPGRQSVALLTPTGATALIPIAPGHATTLTGPMRVTLAKRRLGSVVRFRLELGASLLTDGNFSRGLWDPVGNCDALPGTQAYAAPLLHAGLVHDGVPGGGFALRLSASFETACEARTLTWHSGAVLLQMTVRHVAGAPPRICLWEAPIGRCAALPPLPSGPGWQNYLAMVTPAPGTDSLGLFLYADSTGLGTGTIDDYANIQATSIPTAATPLVVTEPEQPYHRPVLTTDGQEYSPGWHSLKPATHVVVDGLTNGWLALSPVRVTYAPTAAVRAADWASAGGAGLLLLSLAVDRFVGCRRPRRGRTATRTRPRKSVNGH